MNRKSMLLSTVVAALLVLGPGGCGGGGDDTATTTAISTAASFTPKPHKDSGGGSAQFLVKGGDNSVQEFGKEAKGAEFKLAALALHNFLDARGTFNWSAACSFLDAGTREEIEDRAREKGVKNPACEAIFKSLSGATASMRVEAPTADVGSVRVKGDRGFVIYHDVAPTIDYMPITREGDDWKVSATLPSRLYP